MLTLEQRIAAYIRSGSLMHPGERVAIAVSGGADSVGLLRILLELRHDLAIVISVAHFHHGIRGAEADGDEHFVGDLAKAFDLELHVERGDARAHSKQNGISLETAARELRHQMFLRLLEEKKANRIATAHTLDDQTETVLMKFLRGAGTRGLAGIFPEQRAAGGGSLVRPLLEIRRDDLREYLRSLNQPWREDRSNNDVSFTRNRIRARVLPMLREQVNPAADLALAHVAEISRAEEEYWQDQVKRVLPLVRAPGQPARGGGRKQTAQHAIAFDIARFQSQPVAMQRRLLRQAGEQLGCNLDFEHVNAILSLLAQRSSRGAKDSTIAIAKGWRARLLFRELRMERAPERATLVAYQHRLPLPGETYVPELDSTLCARISESNGRTENAAYNRAHSIRLPEVTDLVVRNWRPGDRFQSARHSSEMRVKELLYPMHLSLEQKRLWPVVVAGDRIVWVRGIASPELHTARGDRLWIEESDRGE